MSKRVDHHSYAQSSTNHHKNVVIILDQDPDCKLDQMLKQTMAANRQYTLDKFVYLFEKSFTLRFKPIPIEFVSDKEVVCTYLHLNMFGFLQQGLQYPEWNTKVIMMELVKYNGKQLMNVGLELQNDRDVVLAAVTNDGYAIKFASDILKNDREIVAIAMKFDILIYEYIGESQKSDPEFIEMALKTDGLMLGLVPEDIRKERKFIEMAIKQNPNAILFAPPHLQQDPSIVEKYLYRSPLLVFLLSQVDNETAKLLVSKDERAYQFLPPQQKQDKDVIISMLERNINAMNLMDELVYDNEELMVEVLKIFPQCFEKVPYNLKKKDIILQAFEIGKESEFAMEDVDFGNASLFLNKNKVVSWLSTRKLSPKSATTSQIDSFIQSPYKENARLIMHFGNAYYRDHALNKNDLFPSTKSGDSVLKYGRFPIRVNTIC